jgi:glycosyltransferase involved in cell wall biosynthesis
VSIAVPLVSIGLPVRNGEHRVATTIRSVLQQDHEDLELVISDNASTDATEEICRDLARSDPRVRYHRQPVDLGILGNFQATMRLATGPFFRWVGDDDGLHPSYASRCLDAFARRPEALLVTTQIEYVAPDGSSAMSSEYDPTLLADPDPVERLAGILYYLNESSLLVDPMYSMMRRDHVVAIPRVNTLREDEVFATRLALAGPWEHVPALLAQRHTRAGGLPEIARRLGVPAWQRRVTTSMVARTVLADIASSRLDPADRRRARAAVVRFYLARQRRTVRHRTRRVAGMVAGAVPFRSGGDGQETVAS